MIDKEQPIWVNFHNLDTENLEEIRDFVYLHYPFHAEEGSSQEGLWKAIENYQKVFKEKQNKIRRLVNMWLNEVKPALKTRPERLKILEKILDADPSEFVKNTEERKIGTFEIELNAIIMQIDTRWSIAVVNNKIEREYFENPHSGDVLGVQDSFVYFVEAVIEDSHHEDSQIKKCPRDGCKNILLKSGKRRYCSDKCSREAKRENDRQRGNYNRDTARNHQMLCDLIELWLKLSGNDNFLEEVKEHTLVQISELKENLKVKKIKDGISARNLKTALEYLLDCILGMPVEWSKKYLANHERNYINKYATGKIPFLGDNISADSIGGLLKEVKEKLKREKGIDMDPEKLTKSGKKKKWYTYQFMIKR